MSMLGENLLIWFTIPINLFSSYTKECGFLAKIALAFLGQKRYPWPPRGGGGAIGAFCPGP